MRTWVVLIALTLITSTVLAQPAAGKRDITGTVVDADGKPVGMLDITDLIGLGSANSPAESRTPVRLLDRKSA